MPGLCFVMHASRAASMELSCVWTRVRSGPGMIRRACEPITRKIRDDIID